MFMPGMFRSLAARYAAAVVGAVVAVAIQMALRPWLGDKFPFATLFFAVLFAATFGGVGPAVASTILGAVGAVFFLIEPIGRFTIAGDDNQVGLLLFFGVSLGIAVLAAATRRAMLTAESAVAAEQDQAERLRVTLASIGDGVIVTDVAGRVQSLNAAAETITGWRHDEAHGRPLHDVLRLVDLHTGTTIDDPVRRALESGIPCQLEAHAALVDRHGRRRIIDDSAAPIRGVDGRMTGCVLIFRDVTETAEATLEHQRLAAIVQSSEDAIIGESLDGIIESWNRGAERLFGYTSEEIVGKPITALVPPGNETEVPDLLARLRLGQRIEQVETVRVAKNGQRIDVAITISPIRDEHARVVGASKIARPIGERKRAEQRRSARLAVTQALALSASIPEACHGVLRAVCESFGWDLGGAWLLDADDEKLYCHVMAARAPGDAFEQFERASRQRAFARGEGLPGTVWTSGQPTWISDYTRQPRFPRAELAGALGLRGAFAFPIAIGERFLGVLEFFTHDLRDPDPDLLEWAGSLGGQMGQFIVRKRVELERAQLNRDLAHRVAELQALFDVIPVGIALAADASCRHITVNPALAALLGISPDDNASLSAPEGPRPAYRVYAEGRELAPDELPLQRAAATGATLRDVELEIRLPDGRRGDLSCHAAPLFDASGAVRGAIAAFVDVSGRKRGEVALRDADRRKDEFLAMLGHELRNPLAPICSGLDVLSLSGADDEIVALMREQIDHLVRLVDDLLDVSRITRGKITLRREIVELAEVIRRAERTARPLVEAQGDDLQVIVPATPIWLNGDPTRLAQVFTNLLHNAVKYSERGGRIAITVRTNDDQAVVTVRDTGMGITADLLPLVFEPFRQAEQALDRARGGLGIGLSLVRWLVELHGGSVRAESAGLGQGSCFTITLPTCPAPAHLPADAPPESMPSTARRVLVVDDNAAAAKMVSLLLRKLGGNEVRMVHDGVAALELAADFRPEIVLLDIGLPKINGFEVARRFREEQDGDALLLVALTGYGSEDDRRRSREAGFDVHLIKPPSLEQLRQLLRHPRLECGAPETECATQTV